MGAKASHQPVGDIFPPEIWWKILHYLTSLDLCSVAQTSRHFYVLASDQKDQWSQAKISPRKIHAEGFHQLFSIPRFRHLHTLNLPHWPAFSSLQWEDLLKSSLTSSLQCLDLRCVPLHSIDPHLLGSAVARLVSANLHNTGLTADQLRQLFSFSLKSATLVDLDLSSNENVANVEEELLGNAVRRMRKVDLSRTKLSLDQIKRVLLECLQSKSMKELKMLDLINMRHVQPELITQAKNVFKLFTKSREFSWRASSLPL